MAAEGSAVRTSEFFSLCDHDLNKTLSTTSPTSLTSIKACRQRSRCQCSGRRSLTWDALSTSRSFEITRNERCSQSMKRKGTSLQKHQTLPLGLPLLVADALMGLNVLLETLLTFWYLQASPAICHSQPESARQNTRASPAAISPDALLHTADANSE